MKNHTIIHKLRDLPGSPGITKATWVTSRTAALTVVRQGKAVTAAGSCGALNIWRDRRGKLHAKFMRYCVSESHVSGLTLKDLAMWLREWWPMLTEAGAK